MYLKNVDITEKKRTNAISRDFLLKNKKQYHDEKVKTCRKCLE